ncbi:MAG: hypothetical protein Q8S73_20740 [Deltaproteobacteria bacterium]|nr:hypothetical protein [Myxococcales bacterium]MDP3216549.1 hypothetical protein [Deltaproteobacteria bacterium]
MKVPDHRCYFVDTSYLTELYRVPGFSDPAASAVIRARFGAAWARGDRLFVPLGCLLELGNHIANIHNAPQRKKWAGVVVEQVRLAMDERASQRPFVLVDAPPMSAVLDLVRQWSERHVAAPRGLVDSATAIEAARFKRDRSMGAPVHLWTRDRLLKVVEPDPEPDPFV